MINDISKKAAEYTDSAVELLCQLIDHKSVAAEPLEGMPYGKDCADCLAFAEDILRKDGFAVRNFENHAITASFDEREAELGILCHLDVVPADGQKWTSDPFKAQIREGRVYGRGAIDDKGPAAAIITAMRMIRDSGVKLSKNVRLILGSNEENGSTDMEYYTKCQPFPPMLFTPDGSFPVINIEKGMVRYDMCCPYTKDSGRYISEIHGGSVYNAVPAAAEAVICGIAADEIVKIFKGEDLSGADIAVSETAEGVRVSVSGTAAHASTPEGGSNAVTALICVLSRLFPEMPFKALAEHFPYGESDGRAAGLSCTDEKSGPLTLVLSRLFLENGMITAGFDCRFPVCMSSAEVISALGRIAAASGMTGSAGIVSEPHHADENSGMVQTLLAVYEDCTGKKGECIAIGGGTYVHDTENGVAFGAEWSDENNMHGADEFIGISELTKDIEIYTEAILRLCM